MNKKYFINNVNIYRRIVTKKRLFGVSFFVAFYFIILNSVYKLYTNCIQYVYKM